MKYFALLLLALFYTALQAQENKPKPPAPPIDSLHNLQAMRLIDNLVKNNHQDPLFDKVSVFSNPDCHRCHDLHQLLNENKVEYDLYDLRDLRLVSKIHGLVMKKEKTDKIAYSFPMMIYKGEVYYNIPDLELAVKDLLHRLGR